jgi:phosphate transport system substrate-binding protein
MIAYLVSGIIDVDSLREMSPFGGSLMLKTARLAALLLSAAFVAPAVVLADSSSITAAGSTALLPLVKAAAETYQADHPDVKISVTGGGSRVGITQVAAKAVDLGDSDILAKGYPALVDHRIAVTGFALLVNSGVGVSALTKKQIQDIFRGKITNWKDAGGKDQTIVVINRPRSSGTRAVFIQTLTVGAVSSTPGAISYATFTGVRDRSVTLVKIDGVAPTDENVASGKYSFWSYEHIFTNGAPADATAKFLSFIASNRKLVRQLGYIPISDMKVAENDR